MSMWSPGWIRKLRPVTGSTWKAIAFSPGSSWHAMQKLFVAPTTSWLTCVPLGTGKSAGLPVSCEGSPKRVPETSSGLTALTSTLSGVTGVADGDIHLGDEDIHGRRRGLAGSRVVVAEQHDDADEGHDGEQHPDEDDQAIGSLH